MQFKFQNNTYYSKPSRIFSSAIYFEIWTKTQTGRSVQSYQLIYIPILGSDPFGTQSFHNCCQGSMVTPESRVRVSQGAGHKFQLIMSFM